MRMTVAAAVIWTLMGAPALAQEAVPAAAPEAAPEQIVITGQRPGPGLWKVSKGEHVLWIFGTHKPLPRDLEWRSHQVEQAIAHSQELIYSPRASFKPGFFQVLGMLPHVIGVQKNPDGATLRERVPAEAYERWLALKHTYIGENKDVEAMRPLFAARQLHERALKRVGLIGQDQVLTRIDALARQHKLKVTGPAYQLKVDSPGATLKQFKQTALDDVACFTTTLDYLERDIDALRVRADAWAKGDLATLRATGVADQEGVCDAAMLSGVSRELQDLKNMRQLLDGLWLDAALRALAANPSTFALLPLRQLLEPDGVLAALRAQGYTVESPE